MHVYSLIPIIKFLIIYSFLNGVGIILSSAKHVGEHHGYHETDITPKQIIIGNINNEMSLLENRQINIAEVSGNNAENEQPLLLPKKFDQFYDLCGLATTSCASFTQYILNDLGGAICSLGLDELKKDIEVSGCNEAFYRISLEINKGDVKGKLEKIKLATLDNWENFKRQLEAKTKITLTQPLYLVPVIFEKDICPLKYLDAGLSSMTLAERLIQIITDQLKVNDAQKALEVCSMSSSLLTFWNYYTFSYLQSSEYTTSTLRVSAASELLLLLKEYVEGDKNLKSSKLSKYCLEAIAMSLAVNFAPFKNDDNQREQPRSLVGSIGSFLGNEDISTTIRNPFMAYIKNGSTGKKRSGNDQRRFMLETVALCKSLAILAMFCDCFNLMYVATTTIPRVYSMLAASCVNSLLQLHEALSEFPLTSSEITEACLYEYENNGRKQPKKLIEEKLLFLPLLDSLSWIERQSHGKQNED